MSKNHYQTFQSIVVGVHEKVRPDQTPGVSIMFLTVQEDYILLSATRVVISEAVAGICTSSPPRVEALEIDAEHRH